ncbi:conserved protein, unknown function, partial [Hepatocystis sp. ex Piliocolobus tephrosceles]
MFLKKLYSSWLFFIIIKYLILKQIETKKTTNHNILSYKNYALNLLNHKHNFFQNNRDNIKVKNRKCCKICIPRTFVVFDIIKIFGRISNKELIGHVISYNNKFIELEGNKNKKKKWELLFSTDYVNVAAFKKFLKITKFEWPLTVNSGQIKNQGPIDIP